MTDSVTAQDYALYALRYGILQTRSAADNCVSTPGFTPPPDADPRLFFYTWVAVAGDRVILIDSGCDQATAESRHVTFERPPADSLRVLGIAPEQVSDVVITHVHWDHAGNLSDFPNATIHVHPDELPYATGPAMQHRYLRRPYDVGQLQQLVALNHAGRMRFTAQNATIAPGLSVCHAPGHTPGMQVVRVRTERGVVVIASDSRHFAYNNPAFETVAAPFPVVVDVADYCASSAAVNAMAARPELIIAGHDPIVAEQYPAYAGDELVVELHREPRTTGRPAAEPSNGHADRIPETKVL